MQPDPTHRLPVGLSTQERGIIDAFVAGEKPTITADDVLELLPVSRPHANRILARLAKKGWLVRLHRGIYSVVPLGSPSPEASIDDAWPLAMALFSPGYISGWTAAEHWDLTEQIFNSIVLVTAKPLRSREQTIAGITFICRSIDEHQLFGTKRIWSGSTPVLIADPHRLIIDILAAPELGGGGRHTLDIVRAYWRSKHANPDRLLEYAERYGKGVVFKRLGFTAEVFGSPSPQWLDRCKAGMSEGVSLLDPDGPKQGRIMTRWRLRVNQPIEAA